jgi:hypothetical protein
MAASIEHGRVVAPTDACASRALKLWGQLRTSKPCLSDPPVPQMLAKDVFYVVRCPGAGENGSNASQKGLRAVLGSASCERDARWSPRPSRESGACAWSKTLRASEQCMSVVEHRSDFFVARSDCGGPSGACTSKHARGRRSDAMARPADMAVHGANQGGHSVCGRVGETGAPVADRLRRDFKTVLMLICAHDIKRRVRG